MNFEEISKEEVQVGDWFECIRISNRKQKIPKIDRGKRVLKTISKGGGKVEFQLDDPEITFYRNMDRPPKQDKSTTETEEEVAGDEEDDSEQIQEVTEEQIQKVQDHLDNVEGIGQSKIDSLLEAGYNTIDRLRDADIDDLTEVNGIGDSKAKDIKLSLIQ